MTAPEHDSLLFPRRIFAKPAVCFWTILFVSLVVVLSSSAKAADTAPSQLDSKLGVGSWIWTEETHDKQTCHLWRSFQIPRGTTVDSAHLRITADNSYTVYLDGQELGQGSQLETINDYNLTSILTTGPHVLAVEAFNDYLQAGVILGLSVKLADGRLIEVASDRNWRVVPMSDSKWLGRTEAPANWPNARVVGACGDLPWWKEPFFIIAVQPLRPVTLRFWQTGAFQITLISLFALTCLYFVNRLALQSRAQQLLQRERERIARDIHDDLGAGLTQIVLMGEVAQTELGAQPAVRAQIDQLCEKTRATLRAMNEIVWVVNSRRDTLNDFVSYICKYAQAFLGSTSIRCRFDIDAEIPAHVLDLPVRRNLFLAVKEALNNAAKHSGATEIFLRVHCQDGELLVTVEDNGRGFNPETADRERNGLFNLTQRTTDIGGHCQIVSRPGEGCRMEFKVPLVRSRSFFHRWRNFSISSRKAVVVESLSHHHHSRD